MSETLKDIAFKLGCEANKNGKMRVPAYDERLIGCCFKDCKVGEGVVYLKAWLAGYDFETKQAMKKENFV